MPDSSRHFRAWILVRGVGAGALLAGLALIPGLVLLGTMIALPAAVGLVAAWRCLWEGHLPGPGAMDLARRMAPGGGEANSLGGNRA